MCLPDMTTIDKQRLQGPEDFFDRGGFGSHRGHGEHGGFCFQLSAAIRVIRAPSLH